MNNSSKLADLHRIFNNTTSYSSSIDDASLIKKLYGDDLKSYNMISVLYEFFMKVKPKEQRLLNNEAILIDLEWHESLVDIYRDLLYAISEFFCASFKNHENLLTVNIDNYNLLQFVIDQYIKIDSGAQIIIHYPVAGQFGEEDILDARHEISRIQSCFLMIITSFQHRPVEFLTNSKEENKL